MSDSNARQVGGSHYKTGGEEHWDRVHRLGLDYFQSCITKYVERCWKKNGLEDLQKAQHFLQKYIELKSPPPVFVPTHRHAEGGLYRVLGPLSIHLNQEWVNAVHYCDPSGKEFVRTAVNFNERFIPIDDGSEPGPYYVDQDITHL